MAESFAEYAIAHEAGHAIVGQFVKVGAPTAISFYLLRGPDGRLYLGDFATSFLFPPDDQIPDLPQAVKNCLCYTLAGGFAATQFSGLALPDEKRGLNSDRVRLAKLTPNSLESFVPQARAVIAQEQRAYQEVVSRCRQSYDRLKAANVDEGIQILLNAGDLEGIFKRTMSPLRAPFTATDNTPEFQTTMSAHEAGHATLGITLGARIEAAYAVIADRLPNGNFRLYYLTKFGALGRAGLGMKDKILLTAAGSASEVLLNGNLDDECAARDRADLEELGFSNFEYCVEHAIQLLQQNRTLLNAVRDRIKLSLSDLRRCKLTKKGTHIVLLKGSEIQKLFGKLAFRVSSASLDLDTATVKVDSKLSS